MGEVYGIHTTTGGKLRYYDTESGEHTYDPNQHLTEPIDSFVSDKWKYNQLDPTTNPPKMIGWICPVCGRGLSPFTSVCPCKGFVEGKWEITC